jgi:hypothetical protein
LAKRLIKSRFTEFAELLVKEKLEKMKQNSENGHQIKNSVFSSKMVPKGFARSYSNVISNNANEKQFYEDLTNKISTQIKEHFIELKTTIELNLNEKLEDLKKSIDKSASKLIENNNVKLCHFILDIIKLILPNTLKPNKKQIEIINNRLNVHQMGSISTTALNEYSSKLWSDPSQYLK